MTFVYISCCFNEISYADSVKMKSIIEERYTCINVQQEVKLNQRICLLLALVERASLTSLLTCVFTQCKHANRVALVRVLFFAQVKTSHFQFISSKFKFLIYFLKGTCSEPSP